ncbi:hypothetical protein E4K72_21115 [Oxalobacteraceae bacterium OM1]|nr:hypothetical protein E4K72_21115 [Oxalobacteraceae bacterium OM1]
MDEMRHYPFDRIKVLPGEDLLWHGSNPTFHRGCDYAIVLTNAALYLHRPGFPWIGNKKRIPLGLICDVGIVDSRWAPTMEVRCAHGTVRFRTPIDFDREEMEYDRDKLREAVQNIRQRLSARDANGPVSSFDADATRRST